MPDYHVEADRYRQRAAEIRNQAEQFSSPANRDIMRRIADDYENIAGTLDDIAQTLGLMNQLEQQI